MSLKIRHLRLRAITGQGLFGADIPFSDGLMILRAENSRGKSTAVQSILFALGLERMITTRPTNALTSAMRDRLIYEPSTKAETSVSTSHVSVEIEGLNGDVVTVTRWVVGQAVGTNLVRVQHAPMSDISADTPTDDFYVGRAGGASRERGFHVWLAKFLGWDMPELPAREGRTSQLYMEQVFPLLFVEQRRGWGGIQAQMPAFSGATEVRKRAVEFLLALDVGQYELRRQKLKGEEAELTDSWRVLVASFTQSLVNSGLTVSGLPDRIQQVWPNEPHPARLSVSVGDFSWEELSDFLSGAKASLAALDLFRPSGSPEGVSRGITEALQELRRTESVDFALRRELLRDEAEIRSISQRIDALNEDLRQHQDIVILQSLGSRVTTDLSADCPVCHQHLPDSLLPTEVPTMTASESVEYIKKQIELFSAMAADAERATAAKRERWVAIRQSSDAVSLRIAAMRDDLSGGAWRDSMAETIATRVDLRDRVQRFEGVDDRFKELQAQLVRLASRYKLVGSALKALPKDQLSSSDQDKIRSLSRSFVDQLKQYDFGSFSNDMVDISFEDYLPRRDEFDLQADISASDSVRVIWAYLIGLLEVSEMFDTNHPRLIVFDEPKQQSAKDLSFAALLRRAAGGGSGRQVIFATSEPLEGLRGMLVGLDHTLHVVDGYLLKKLA